LFPTSLPSLLPFFVFLPPPLSSHSFIYFMPNFIPFLLFLSTFAIVQKFPSF
jgi:hypothetical protein